MVNEYLATPEELKNIASMLINRRFATNENFKELFISGLKKYSTCYEANAEENIHTDNYSIFKFAVSDNKTRLLNHLNDTFAKEKLKEYNWLINESPREIEYKINRNGFRCNNFTSEPGIIFVGCSNTYGIGMTLENNWPSIVSKYFNLECWNLGTPGLSISSGTFYLLNWISDIPNPKAIVLLEPPDDRFELYTLKNDHIMISLLKTMLDSMQSSGFKNRIYQALSTTSTMQQICDIQCLTLLAEKLNIPFIRNATSDIIKTVEEIDFARDLMHFGNKMHSKIANHVIDQLKIAGL